MSWGNRVMKSLQASVDAENCEPSDHGIGAVNTLARFTKYHWCAHLLKPVLDDCSRTHKLAEMMISIVAESTLMVIVKGWDDRLSPWSLELR